MKVFISWSGDKSKKVGEAIRDWLPTVLQTVKPYFTPSDIEKGTRWSSDIAQELDDATAGIFCITKENMNSQWLMFEAGAISKRVEQSLVCPILIGIDNSDISGPLTQFQTTLFDKAEVKKLVFSINKANTSTPLEESVLNSVFNKWWPDLEEKIEAIIKKEGFEVAQETDIRSDRDVLEEVLDLSRALAIQKSGGFQAHKELNQLISNFIISFHIVFDIDWEYTEQCLVDSKFYIEQDGTFINPLVHDEENNWGNRASLLNAYRELVDYIATHKIDIKTTFESS